MNDLRRVLVFGATSAIARAAARRLARQGASLYCVGRDPGKLAALLDDLRVRAGGRRVDGIAVDLNETAAHPGLFEKARDFLGGIDAVLIAHGTLPDQKSCEASVEKTLAEIHTNALSVISLLTIAANLMEQQGGGTIAVIASVAGDRGRKSNYVYGAAKGMVTRFMEGLRNRLDGRGVHVLTIKPGFVDTPMTVAFGKQGPLWASADRVAEGIVNAMMTRRDVVYLPWFWRYIMLVIRHVPERIFKRMSL